MPSFPAAGTATREASRVPPEPIVPADPIVSPELVVPAAPLVDVTDLSVRFVNRDIDVQVVEGVSFQLAAGKCCVCSASSGSGKTVTMRALLRLLPPHARIGGRISLAGHDIIAMTEQQLNAVRGPVAAMIFQEPMTALDPVFTHRDPNLRNDRRARAHLLARRAQAGAGIAGDGANPVGRATPRCVSARIIRRLAATRDDCPGVVLPSSAAARR